MSALFLPRSSGEVLPYEKMNIQPVQASLRSSTNLLQRSRGLTRIDDVSCGLSKLTWNLPSNIATARHTVASLAPSLLVRSCMYAQGFLLMASSKLSRSTTPFQQLPAPVLTSLTTALAWNMRQSDCFIDLCDPNYICIHSGSQNETQ